MDVKNIDLNNLRDKAYHIACEHGFHDTDLSDEHFLMLIITELSEAVEADRKSKRAMVDAFLKEPAIIHLKPGHDGIVWRNKFNEYIKDTIEDELAGAAIRLLDFAGKKNLNLNRFCLQYVVSYKKTFPENIYSIVKDIMNYKYSQEEQVNYAIRQIQKLCEILNIDLFWYIEKKMEYNEYRPKMHGKKY